MLLTQAVFRHMYNKKGKLKEIFKEMQKSSATNVYKHVVRTPKC